MPPSRTAAQLEFSLKVRDRRRDLGLSAAEVSHRMGFSRVYLSSVENARALLADNKLPDLARILQLSNAEEAELAALLTEARQPFWWTSLAKYMPDGVEQFVGLEWAATRMRIYESRLVTGLLQTREYATAVTEASPIISASDVRHIVDIRMRRQERLESGDPPAIELIFNESVLMQHYGGRDVLRRQLERLSAVLHDPSSRISLRIQPFVSTPRGFTAASTAIIMDFDDRSLPTMAWQEAGQYSGLLYEEEDVAGVLVRYREALAAALGQESSLEMLRARLNSSDLR